MTSPKVERTHPVRGEPGGLCPSRYPGPNWYLLCALPMGHKGNHEEFNPILRQLIRWGGER